MLRDIRALVSVEVFQLFHRTATWVLLGIWAFMGLFFPYLLPYLLDESEAAAGPASLLPASLVQTVIGGFPFYGGAIALMLGVLTIGSEFGWGTFKTLFAQGPGRSSVFIAKLVALGIVLVPFVLAVFAIGGVASTTIALIEGEAISAPSAVNVIEGILAGWLILAVWAALGVLLATWTRGTSLAIGVGILYALVIEGLISNFANGISWLEPVVDGFLRANAYSLIRPFGDLGGMTRQGPGAFAGPYVGTAQSAMVLIAYLLVASAVGWWLLRRRDVA